MLQENALALFRQTNPYPSQALENHNLRIGTFAQALGEQRQVEVDQDLLWAGCHLHDIGLLVTISSEPQYQKRSFLFSKSHASQWGCSPSQLDILRQILRFTHSLRTVPGLDPLADLVRRAVQVEHAHGLITHGLSKQFCKEVFQRYPRLDLTNILIDFARITLIKDGPRQLLPIFWPREKP